MRFSSIGIVALSFVAAWGSAMSPKQAEAQATATPFKFEGKWMYQSYHPVPESIDGKYEDKSFAKWSPPGEVTFTDDGKKGVLVFPAKPGLELELTLTLSETNPLRLHVVAKAIKPAGLDFTNELQAFLVPADLAAPDGPKVFRGTIVQTSNSPPGLLQPKFTTGFFVLRPGH